MSKPVTIGELAHRTGVPAKTIRYYEEIGLLPEPSRGDNGYRRYDVRASHKLRFVKRARELGFSIEQVHELLALWDDPKRASAEVKAIAARHIEEVERKIVQLESMRRTLLHLVHQCHGDQRPDCPILDDLARSNDAHEECHASEL